MTCFICEHNYPTEAVVLAGGNSIALCGTCFDKFPDEFVADSYSL